MCYVYTSVYVHTYIWVLFYIIIILISNIFAIKMILTIFFVSFYFIFFNTIQPLLKILKPKIQHFSIAFSFKHVCIFGRFFCFFSIFYGKEMFLLLIQTSVYGRNIYFKWIFSLILSTYVATLILYPWIDLLFVCICENV